MLNFNNSEIVHKVKHEYWVYRQVEEFMLEFPIFLSLKCSVYNVIIICNVIYNDGFEGNPIL